MNRANRRQEQKKNKKKIKLIEVKSEISEMLSNDGRIIIIDENSITALNPAIFLHHTLERFGDFTGVNSQAEISLRFNSGKPQVSVNQDCYFEGYLNGFSGKMEAKTVALAIEMMFSNHYSEYLNENNKIEQDKKMAVSLKDNFMKLIRQDSQKLTEEEKTELYKFLD